jgi:hypothetical protein
METPEQARTEVAVRPVPSDPEDAAAFGINGAGRHFWRRPAVRRARRVLLVLLALFVIVVGTSITNALTAPGTDSTSVRLAEWGRHAGRWHPTGRGRGRADGAHQQVLRPADAARAPTRSGPRRRCPAAR